MDDTRQGRVRVHQARRRGERPGVCASRPGPLHFVAGGGSRQRSYRGTQETERARFRAGSKEENKKDKGSKVNGGILFAEDGADGIFVRGPGEGQGDGLGRGVESGGGAAPERDGSGCETGDLRNRGSEERGRNGDCRVGERGGSQKSQSEGESGQDGEAGDAGRDQGEQAVRGLAAGAHWKTVGRSSECGSVQGFDKRINFPCQRSVFFQDGSFSSTEISKISEL